MANLFKKGKTRHQIASTIKDIKEKVQEVAARRDRNKVGDNVARLPAMTSVISTIDPRLRSLYTDATELVGIYGKRDQEIIKLLTEGVSEKKLKIVCVVEFGGLGKTTLARAVYEKIKGDFDCRAFVPVGRNPDVKKVFRDILIDLDKQKYTNINLMILNERQLIDELREFLENKRYLVIIDDIWDENLWKDIKLAFSERDNLGSRLITTTRIVSVSKACCSSTDDIIYKMKPLTDHDSQMLFSKRIFCHQSGCPSEFEQISKDILKKCGGVPLAIITIASILASNQDVKPKDEWHVLLHSIGRGLAEEESLEEMRRILLLSYYDLPSHLKTCLLYLSIYPEDRKIERDQLIWKWLAESIVHSGKHESSLFEVGLTYFNELVNRSMIQPIYDYIGQVEACFVHDMVLDLICLLSSEENFVTMLDGTKGNTSSLRNTRRLSLQNGNKDHEATFLKLSMSMSQVRSITIFSPAVNMTPPLSSFDVLRVLDLGGCNLGETRCQLNLRDIGNLFHLRYRCLKGTGIPEVPAQIGNLQFLQVLDVAGNPDLQELPPTICNLRRLMLLHVDRTCRRIPDGLGDLISLEVLKHLRASLNNVQGLGNLARLRDLEIRFTDRCLALEEAFVESLCSLHNVQNLVIDGNFRSLDLLGQRWVPSGHLRRFVSHALGVFSALPAWIWRDPLRLSSLSHLRIIVKEVHQEDMCTLGRLPAIRHLWIESTHQAQRQIYIGADGFCCMIFLALFCGSDVQIVFEQGALLKTKEVHVTLGVRAAKDGANSTGLDSGLQDNLLSLRHAVVFIYRGGATVGEAREVEAAVRHALQDHHNNPTFSIAMVPYIQGGALDDDFCQDCKRFSLSHFI
ncbi:unnamed protein product [Alopecurus aequalis]